MANSWIQGLHVTMFVTLSVYLFAKAIPPGDPSYAFVDSSSSLTFGVHHIHKRQIKASSFPIDIIDGSSRQIKSEGNHKYYTSKILQFNNMAGPYWEDLHDVNPDDILSDGYRIALTVNLSLQIPFYGNQINKITIAPGGFLYMSPFLHQWLSATQYIAPLMANFDTSLGNESEVIHKEFHDKFVVEWRNLYLKDQNHTNSFHFQTTLHRDGTIVFAYKVVPLPVSELSTTSHPVKVGLSDGYYIDTKVGGTTRRTIYEYFRISINSTLITDNTVVIFKPLATCNIAEDCETCVTQVDEFDCKWCGLLQRCSDGLDWNRQEWRENGCETMAVSKNCYQLDNKLLTTDKRKT